MSVNVQVEADAGVRMLDQIEQRLDEPAPMLRFLADEIADYEREVFATQGFGTWAPLDPDTVRAKGSSRVLVDTGGLLDELTNPGAGNVSVSGDTVTVRAAELSALFLQRGARGMPKRNPVPKPPPTTVNKWAEHLLGALTEGTLAR